MFFGGNNSWIEKFKKKAWKWLIFQATFTFFSNSLTTRNCPPRYFYSNFGYLNKYPLLLIFFFTPIKKWFHNNFLPCLFQSSAIFKKKLFKISFGSCRKVILIEGKKCDSITVKHIFRVKNKYAHFFPQFLFFQGKLSFEDVHGISKKFTWR